MRLSRNFYNRPTLKVAADLLGKSLVFIDKNGDKLSGLINETEAYIGENDPACHAARGLTARNKVMYGPAGFAYIYFIYGMYFCLNIVTERENFPAAVLIRGVIPQAGLKIMMKNRSKNDLKNLTDGPGKLCRAFGLTKEYNGLDLCAADNFYLEDLKLRPKEIRKTARIGIKEGGELEWRFLAKEFS